MPNYRRVRNAGGTYFFTVVTAQRRPILLGRYADLLLEIFSEAGLELPFDSEAFVILPDHLHAIWRLPEGDHNYSKRWGLIKSRFSKRSGLLANSRLGEYSGLWQPRFWEHAIRDEADWRTHMDYIHFNPVKHGLAKRVVEWPYSSFRRCVAQGWYEPDWGIADGKFDEMHFGE